MDHRHRPKPARHPLQFVCELVGKLELGNAKLHYSIYAPELHTITDNRSEYSISGSELKTAWLDDMLSKLAPNEELAFHSLVTLNGKKSHIPMIDFGGRHDEIKNLSVVKEFLKYWNLELEVYSSGRSYHGYGDRLFTEKEWIKFMGSILLLNIPGKVKIIDTRWVGHRLLGGYSSLRWSNNTRNYKRYPAHMGSITQIAH